MRSARLPMIVFLTKAFTVIWLALAALPAAAQETPEAQQATDPALTPLLNVLEDPEARDRLISALRATTDTPDEMAPEALPDRLNFAAQLAETTREAAETLVTRGQNVMDDIAALRVLPGLMDAERRAQIVSEGLELLLTIVVTVVLYRLLRMAGRRLLPKPPDADTALVFFAVHLTGQVILRMLAVLLAWVAGYGLAYFFFSSQGVALPQALYLNAFLFFGIFTVALSVLVSHHPDDLTFSGLPQKIQSTTYHSVRRLGGLGFYGVIAAVPITQSWTNFVVARSLRTILLTLFAVLAVVAIRRISRAITAEAAATAEPSDATGGPAPAEDLSGALASNSTRIWNAVWPPMGYLYVAVAYLVAISNPNLAVEIVGRATVFTALALVAALFGLRLLKLAPQNLAAPVPRGLAQLLPTLPDRMAAFVTPALVAAGVAALATGAALVLEGWGLLSLSAWLADGGTDFAWRMASFVLLLAGLILFWVFLASYVDKKLAADLPEDRQVSARSRTLLALFRNTVSIALVVFGGMTLLSELGVDIAPLLAGAGVIGLAIGFGAQKLVQDIITGVFIQLENAINEGDVVTVAGITGGVEKLTIRSVGIRDLTGTYHIIPFSAVDTVGNYMRRFAFHVEVVGVAYDSDLDVVKQALHDAFDRLTSGEFAHDITAPLEYHGVIGLADSAVNVRVRIKTKPGKQWGVGRAYTQEVKRALDAAGIEIPFPHRELKLPPDLMRRLLPPEALPAPTDSAPTDPAQTLPTQTHPSEVQGETKPDRE